MKAWVSETERAALENSFSPKSGSTSVATCKEALRILLFIIERRVKLMFSGESQVSSLTPSDRESPPLSLCLSLRTDKDPECVESCVLALTSAHNLEKGLLHRCSARNQCCLVKHEMIFRVTVRTKYIRF